MGPYNLAAMRTFPRVFLLALCFGVLLGCQGRPPAAVWLADTPSAPWLVASTASDVGEEFRLHRLPCVPAAADGAPAFSGQVIATVARGKGVRLYFHDGAVCDFDPDAPGTLRSVAAPDAAGGYLTATRVDDADYALQATDGGGARLCRLAPAAGGPGSARWEALALPLPLDKAEPLTALCACRGLLVLAWRRASATEMLSGLNLAVLDEKHGEWHWLPSPPRNLLSRVFAIAAAPEGADGPQGPAGLALAQDDPAARQTTLARFVPGEGASAAAFAAGRWEQLALTPFAGETMATPAHSLELCVGPHGLHLARATEDGIRVLAAPRFPDDPGAEAPSPQPEEGDSSPYPPGRALWWMAVGLVLAILVLRRRARAAREVVAKGDNDNGSDNGGAPDLARQLELLKTGGIASIFDRAFAMLLDGMICFALPLGYLLASGGGGWPAAAASRWMVLLWVGGMAVYSTAAEMLWGRTPGKAILKMRVRDADGGRPAKWQILVRNLVRFVDFYPFAIGSVQIWYLVAAAFAIGTARTQRLGDLLGRTVVRYHRPLRQREIVLASASEQRQVLLRTLGLDFSVRPALGPERQNPRLSPAEAAIAIAEGKAEEVAERSSRGALVIAADTVVVVDGDVLGKPRDDDDARRMLRRLSGRDHQVITSVVLIDNATGQGISDCAFTNLTWKTLSDDDIEAYIRTGEHRGRAGAYGIQGRAAAFTVDMQGSLSNVIGLPLELLAEMLEDLDA